MEWSPDGTKLTFVQRDEKGEKGELWYVDAATGEKKVLVSAAKLASLDPDVNKVKNEREKERLTRYHVAAYLWAPDSKHLIFDSQGQLWLYDLGTETGGAVYVRCRSQRRSQVFSRWQTRRVCAQAQSLRAARAAARTKSS